MDVVYLVSIFDLTAGNRFLFWPHYKVFVLELESVIVLFYKKKGQDTVVCVCMCVFRSPDQDSMPKL